MRPKSLDNYGSPSLRFPTFDRGWEQKRLKEVVQPDRRITYGIVQPGTFVEKGIPLVRGKDYSKGWALASTLKNVTPEIDRPYKRSKLLTGDLLITIVGANTGTVAVVPKWLSGANITQTTARVAVDRSKSDPGFIEQLLKSRHGKGEVSRYIKGGAQPGLNLSDLERFRIPTPTLPEQRKIADFLTAVDGRIGQLIQKKALLEDYKKGVMQQLFTQTIRFKDNHGKNFPDWEEKTLGNYLISNRLGGNYSNSETVTEYPLIKMGNLGRGAIVLNKLNYVSKANEIDSDDLLKEGHLLFNTRNTLDLVGKVAIWRGELSGAYYNSNIMRLEFPNTWFMNYWFNYYQGLKSLRRIATGTTSVAAIYTKDLLKISMVVPSPAEQTKIADFLSAIDRKIESVASQIVETQTFKKGLLQQMFV